MTLPRQRRGASSLPVRTFHLSAEKTEALVALVQRRYDSLPMVGRHTLTAGDVEEVFFYKRTEAELTMNLKLARLDVRFEYAVLGNGTCRIHLGALSKTDAPPTQEEALAAVEAGLQSPDYIAILLTDELN